MADTSQLIGLHGSTVLTEAPQRSYEHCGDEQEEESCEGEPESNLVSEVPGWVVLGSKYTDYDHEHADDCDDDGNTHREATGDHVAIRLAESLPIGLHPRFLISQLVASVIDQHPTCLLRGACAPRVAESNTAVQEAPALPRCSSSNDWPSRSSTNDLAAMAGSDESLDLTADAGARRTATNHERARAVTWRRGSG